MQRIFVVLILSLTFFVGDAKSYMLKNVLDSLEVALIRQPDVLAKNSIRADSIKKAIEGERASVEGLRKLADAYRGLNNDSAIHYYNKALTIAFSEGDSAHINYILPELAQRLSKASRVRTAINTLDTIDVSSWSTGDKIRYYSSLSHVYLDAIGQCASPFESRKYTDLALKSLDSLYVLLPSEKGRSIVAAQRYFLTGHPALGLAELNEVFNEEDSSFPGYALIANLLASFYKDRPDGGDEYAYYLALSAISDAQRANGESMSLMNLGEEMFRRGDFDRAFRYLGTAGEMISSSETDLYGTEVARSLSRFAKIWSERERTSFLWYCAFIVVLLCCLVAVVCLLYKSRKRRAAQLLQESRLSDSLINRDLYINQLINLCGVYVEGLDEFNRLVARKLKVNQVQDLYELIESGKVMREQSEHFFEAFDHAVLKIYPDFIEEINSLLVDDKKMAPLTGEKLNPELRILAFMRLGVVDSNKLSKFLGLSVNTVYAYRNRMKNKAVNRADFERNLMNLGKNL